MEDKIIIALIAATAAILGGLISGFVQYKITSRKALGDEMKIGLEILKERIDRIEKIKKEHLEAQRSENEEIKNANDATTVIAFGAMSAVRIGSVALTDYGHLFPESSVHELQLILDRIQDCKKSIGTEHRKSEDNPIELSFKFNDDIGKLIDVELRSLGKKVNRILARSIN